MKLFLDEYLAVLRLEKNLSANTVESYKNDIANLIQFLQNYNIEDPEQIKYNHLAQFFKFLKDAGLASSSASRYHSSLKGFFSYLFQNQYITKNPVEKIPSPKLSKKLPQVLSVNEIEAILAQPDVKNKLGLRDKALLEMFYACGIRVSELINIKISGLYFKEEIIRVFGKGSKERLVPIGRSAIMWVTEYLKLSRPLLEKKNKSENYLFLNTRGTKLSRMGIWKIVDRYVKEAKIDKENTFYGVYLYCVFDSAQADWNIRFLPFPDLQQNLCDKK